MFDEDLLYRLHIYNKRVIVKLSFVSSIPACVEVEVVKLVMKNAYISSLFDGW